MGSPAPPPRPSPLDEVAGTRTRLDLDDPRLLEDQYVDTTRLMKRQAIWSLRVPAADLILWALDLAELEGSETVVDVGCGNGRYLQSLLDRGHHGALIGIDRAQGMVRSAPADTARLVADAVTLSLAESVADVTLAMHMMYHVPDKSRAVSELRRVTRPGGRLLVAGNDRDTLVELHSLIDTSAMRLGIALPTHDPGLTPDEAAAFLDGLFEVTRVDLPGELHVTEAAMITDYVASLSRVRLTLRTSEQAALLGEIHDAVQAGIDIDGAYRLTASAGCLVCR